MLGVSYEGKPTKKKKKVRAVIDPALFYIIEIMNFHAKISPIINDKLTNSIK